MLIQTRHHAILFDAGPRYPSGYSAGERVVWPYLRQQGIKYLDGVIISHPDLDHIGGLYDIASHIPIKWGYTSQKNTLGAIPESICQAGMAWNIDGVDFAFLWPDGTKKLSKNNNSCVLRIQTKASSALLTGDLEKRGERLLLNNTDKNVLSATWLLAPHHGSKGASTEDFIRAVSPEYVVFTTGKYNGYHFPHKATLARYHCAVGRICFNTANTGTMTFNTDHNVWHTHAYRTLYPRIWHWIYRMEAS